MAYHQLRVHFFKCNCPGAGATAMQQPGMQLAGGRCGTWRAASVYYSTIVVISLASSSLSQLLENLSLERPEACGASPVVDDSIARLIPLPTRSFHLLSLKQTILKRFTNLTTKYTNIKTRVNSNLASSSLAGARLGFGGVASQCSAVRALTIFG